MLDNRIIHERYEKENASFIDINDKRHILWENGLEQDILFENAFASYFFFLGVLFFGTLALFILSLPIEYLTNWEVLDWIINNYYWVLPAIFVVWHYKFQEHKARQIQVNAAVKYFNIGIDEAYRQLYLASNELTKEEFTQLLERQFETEYKIDLINKSRQRMIEKGELKKL